MPANQWQPPQTGDRQLDYSFNDLASRLAGIDALLASIAVPTVRIVRASAQIGEELYVEYRGGGLADFVTLPDAAIRGKGRGSQVTVQNQGTSAITVRPFGQNTINDGTTFTLAIGEGAIFSSNGVDHWTGLKPSAGGSVTIQEEGVTDSPSRSILNFTGNVTVTDDPGNTRKDIDVPFPEIVNTPYVMCAPRGIFLPAGCHRDNGVGSEPWNAESGATAPTKRFGTFIFAFAEVAPFDATIDALKHYCDSAAPIFWIGIARNTTAWDGLAYPGAIDAIMSFSAGGLVGARLRGGAVSVSVSKGELFWVLYQCDGLHDTFGFREASGFRVIFGNNTPEIFSTTVPLFARGQIGWVTHRQVTYDDTLTDFPSGSAALTIDTDTIDFDWTANTGSLTARLATTAALPACTAAGSGVGKTLTGVFAGALTVDGATVNLNDLVLVKDQANPVDNGLYKCTTAGGGGAFVLTRDTSMDTTGAETTPGVKINVTAGTVYNGQNFVLTGQAKMLGGGNLPLLATGGNTLDRPSVYFKYAT